MTDDSVAALVIALLALGLAGGRLVYGGSQLRRLRLEVERLSRRLEGPAGPSRADVRSGLPIGSEAPEIDAPLLGGGLTRLADWRGRRVLLIFVRPTEAESERVLAALGQLAWNPSSGMPLPFVVTTGSPTESRRAMERHDIRWPMVLDEDRRIASPYRVGSYPAGYLIDERGALLGEPIVGAPGLLALVGEEPPKAVPAAPGAEPSASGEEQQWPPDYAGEALRRLRGGLPAGSPAPAFRLPRLDGGELTLDAYRGRWVLLVFSDPECPACDELAVDLEQLYRRQERLEVLLVSRGSPEANRAWAARLGLTLPTALQRGWDLSREYQLVAAPVGYLIDERSVIAAEVAIGAEAIRDLTGEQVPG